MAEGESVTEVPVKKNIFPLKGPYAGENLFEGEVSSAEIDFSHNNGLLLKTLIPSTRIEEHLDNSPSPSSYEWSDYTEMYSAVTEKSPGKRPAYDEGVFLTYSILSKAATKEGTSLPQVSEEQIKACEMDLAILQQDHTEEEVFFNAMRMLRLSDRNFYATLKGLAERNGAYVTDPDFVKGAIQTYYPLRFAAESSDRSVTKPFILGRLFKGEQ